MIVRMSQPTLSDLLKTAVKFTPTRTTIPALKGVYLEAFEDEDGSWLLASATDMKSGLRIWGKAVVTEPGTCVVDAETFSGFIAALDSLATIDLKIEGNKLVASARSAKASFALLPVDEFPVTSGPVKAEACFTINARRLASLVHGAQGMHRML